MGQYLKQYHANIIYNIHSLLDSFIIRSQLKGNGYPIKLINNEIDKVR